ncbi:hypothetical protein [Caproiciproducens sp.]|uniref:hypothetical protein n=1 Tax=Caproiciproducens sp. TaxID=1954376 RepID=UPI00289D6F6C|nr:hypothetical protein [Caproiciproducens sp.]
MEIMPCEFDSKNHCVVLYADKDKTKVLFNFQLLREKSKETNAEHINVTAEQDGALYGSVIIRLSSMLEDFIKIKDFGVLIPRSKYNDICKVIEANYYALQQNLVSSFGEELSKSIIDDIFDMFCIYIAEQEIVPQANTRDKHEYYNVPVEKFADNLKDSIFEQFDITDIKKKLLEVGYTHYNKGSLANNVIGADKKPHKVISFDAKKVQSKEADLGITLKK